MHVLSALTRPWCLFNLLLLISVLLIAAALHARSKRAAQQPPPRARPSPRTPKRGAVVAASAPFEALQALGERLAELQRHLQPGSADARWLESFRNDLRNVMDDLYWEVWSGSATERLALLERLGREVEQLDHIISQRLSTTISGATDRAALHCQLDQLRRSINL